MDAKVTIAISNEVAGAGWRAVGRGIRCD